ASARTSRRHSSCGTTWRSSPPSSSECSPPTPPATSGTGRAESGAADVLDSPGEQAELVALRVAEDHPADVRPLSHVGAPGAEREQPVELLLGRHTVGAQVEVEPVLHALALGDDEEVDRGPRAVRRPDRDPLLVLVDDAPAEDGAP